MVNTRKRLEALIELFNSEKTYIEDLILWESDFRKHLLNLQFLSLKIRYEICDIIFINMHEIRLVHEQIFQDMKDRNYDVRKKITLGFVKPTDDTFCIDKSSFDNPHVLELEYCTLFFKYASKLTMYKNYFSKLPMAEYELEKISYFSSELDSKIKNFFKKKNLEHLGIRNFLYRPSTKLSRLPLLLQAIRKNEGNKIIAANYELLINKVKQTTYIVEAAFKETSEQCNIYKLFKTFDYSNQVKNKMSLGLFQKKRRLLKEGEVLFKAETWLDPVFITIYIFDNCIIFCDKYHGPFKRQKILYDPIFIDRLICFDVNVGFEHFEYDERKYFPLFLLETGDCVVRTLLFDDYEIKEIYMKLLSRICKENKSTRKKKVKINGIDLNLQNISYACMYKNDEVNKAIEKDIEENVDRQDTDDEDADQSKSTESSASSDNTSASLHNNENSINTSTLSDTFLSKEFKNAIAEYEKKIHAFFSTKRPQISRMLPENNLTEEPEDSAWLSRLLFRRANFSFVLNCKNSSVNSDLLKSIKIEREKEMKEKSEKEMKEESEKEMKEERDKQQDGYNMQSNKQQGEHNMQSNKQQDGYNKQSIKQQGDDKQADMDVQRDKLQNFEDIEKYNKEVFIVSNKEGIFVTYKNIKKCIYKKRTKKVIYDFFCELLMFQTESDLFVCHYNYKTDNIEPLSIKKNIRNFFYGKNAKGAYIASINYGESKSSLVYLFRVIKKDNKIFIDLSSKLYLGFDVQNIIFSSSKIIIACEDFEIVDMETLKTEQFLEPFNPCIPMVFSMISNYRALALLAINLDTFILCFNSMGFYTDQQGRIINTNVFFVWRSIPLHFKLHKNNLIVISRFFLDVFDIETGNIIYSKFFIGLKFMQGTDEVILHDNNNFYRLEI